MDFILDKVKIKGGSKSSMPILEPREPYLCLDTEPMEMWVGTINGNKAIGGVGIGTGGDSVTGASTNGFILVNGSQLKVYDDTTINNALSNKAAQGDFAALAAEIANARGAYNNLSTKLDSIVVNGGGAPENVILFADWAGGESVTIDNSIGDTIAPTLSITAGGTFTGQKTVTMSANETANIYFTLDGSNPTTGSAVYTTPLSIGVTTTLKAFARDAAGNQSVMQTVVYTLDAAPADTTPPANITDITFSAITPNGVTLTWAPVADAASYDILRDSTIVSNVTGTTYNATGLAAQTQYNFTVKPKDAANNTASGYSEQITTAAPPVDTTPPVLTITPAATFSDSQTVNMSTNETADIWYTVDGTDPKTSGTKVQYFVPVILSATTTLKAYAVDSANNESSVQTIIYTKQAAGAFAAILDSFNRMDNLALGTTETGQTYEQHADVRYGIRNNKAYQSQQVQGGIPRYRKIPTVTVPSNAFAVELTFATLDTATNANESIHVRYVNSVSTVMVYKNTGKYNIAKFGAGGFLNLKTGTKVPANGDRLRIEHKSNGVIDLYVNGVLDATATDTEYLSTSHKVGFGTENSVSEFEDFKIEPLA